MGFKETESRDGKKPIYNPMTKMMELRLRLSVERHCRDNVPWDDNIRPTAQLAGVYGSRGSVVTLSGVVGFGRDFGVFFSLCFAMELGGVCLFIRKNLDHGVR